jgi:hypothetical protein
MAEITLIVGSLGLVVAGFTAWYALAHRRVESSLEKVPVRTGRPLHLVRDGDSDLDERSR